MLENQIEAILFVKGEPVSVYELARLLETDPEKVEEAANHLRERLVRGGLRLMHHDYHLELRTAPECASWVEKLLKEDVNSDLTKAALETLSIVLYQGPVSAREIDFVRGVNSRNTLRSLSSRGLVEREQEGGQNGFVYKPSMDLLAYLGVSKIDEMPEYAETRQKIEGFWRNASDSTDS